MTIVFDSMEVIGDCDNSSFSGILNIVEYTTNINRIYRDCSVRIICFYFAGEPMVAADAGVWDNYCVKKQLLHSWYVCIDKKTFMDYN